MFYVVTSGSNQFLVKPGQKIIVDRLNNTNPGDSVELRVLFSSDKSSKKSIKAKIIEHIKSEKVVVMKFKAKSDYRRKYGARQYQTVLEIQA